MSGVGVHVSAPIGPEHLNGYLGGNRSLHDALRIDLLIDHHRIALRIVHRISLVVLLRNLHGLYFYHFRGVVRLKVLHHTLGDEEESVDDTDRKQQVVVNPDEIHPKITERLRGMPRNSSDDGCGKGYADRRRKEIMRSQS